LGSHGGTYLSAISLLNDGSDTARASPNNSTQIEARLEAGGLGLGANGNVLLSPMGSAKNAFCINSPFSGIRLAQNHSRGENDGVKG